MTTRGNNNATLQAQEVCDHLWEQMAEQTTLGCAVLRVGITGSVVA